MGWQSKQMRTVVSRCFLWCFGVLLSHFSSVVVAADTPCAKVKHRPCVALVLGGGGARGGAHVGVLKELERLQIPVDLIVGTSIGAYVGGLYALGHSPAEIERIMRQTAWGQGFRDRVERDEMPMRRKQQRDEFPINLDLGLDSSGFKLPKGVLHGQAMAALIQQAYGVVPEFASFDTLPIPFRAVATDLANRDTVVLAEGSLLLAVQASMSIPGVVRPMEINNRWLVDGGVANNLPISVAKSLGADRVIAVAIDAPLLQQQQLDSAMAITEQLTSFLVREAVERQLTLLGPEDVLLQPALAKIGTLDFAQIDVAIDAGQQVAKQAATQLVAFSQPEHYANWRQQHQLQDHSRMQLADVVLDNRTGLADELLLQRLGLSPQQKLNSTELTKALRRVYGLDTLERISSSLIRTEDGQQQLKLQALPKSWGPAYLNFRFQLEDDFSNTHNYQIAASYLWTELSAFGAEWQTDLALGSDKLFKTQLYWPLADSGFYTAARMQQSRTLLGLENSIGLSDGELNNTEFQFGAELGFHPLDNANLSLGLVQRDGYYRFPAAIASQFNVGTLSYLRRGVETSLVMDTLDQLSFPTRGYKFQGSLQRLQDNVLGGRSHSHSSLLRAETATRFGAHIWHGRVRWDNFSGADGTVALEQFTLGGLLNLSGYPKNYLFGSQIRFGSLVYLYQLSDSRLSFFNAPFYLGASLERGMVTEPRFGDRSLAQHDQWLWAGSLFAGWDSPFGPLYLGYGQAESGPQEKPYRFYLSLGQTF